MTQQESPKSLSPEWLRERAFVDVNEYVAALVNADLIDNRYVAPRLKCDIAWIKQLVLDQRRDLAPAARAISAYVDANRADCRS